MKDNFIIYNQIYIGAVTDDTYWRNRSQYRYSINAHDVQVVWSGGLYGNTAEAIIKIEGQLHGKFRESYLGAFGWKISLGEMGMLPCAPAPPKRVLILLTLLK